MRQERRPSASVPSTERLSSTRKRPLCCGKYVLGPQKGLGCERSLADSMRRASPLNVVDGGTRLPLRAWSIPVLGPTLAGVLLLLVQLIESENG